jgi:hypothetical protein
MAFDQNGNLYVADHFNTRVRKIGSLVTNCPTPTPTVSPTPGVAPCETNLFVSKNLFSVSADPIPLSIELTHCGGPYQISVYNTAGEQVRILGAVASQLPGLIPIEWDGTNEFGELVASGVYIIRLTVSSETKIAKVALIR